MMRNDRFDPSKFPMDNFVVPDLTEAVEGWRAWKLSVVPPRYGTMPKLGSVTNTYWWAPRRRSEATCDRKCKETVGIPGEQCSCGFYSAKDLAHLKSLNYHFYDPAQGMFTVIGQVANWGKVIEGDMGWRAQYSYPVKLFIPYEMLFRFGKSLRDTYGVPVKPLNILKQDNPLIH